MKHFIRIISFVVVVTLSMYMLAMQQPFKPKRALSKSTTEAAFGLRFGESMLPKSFDPKIIDVEPDSENRNFKYKESLQPSSWVMHRVLYNEGKTNEAMFSHDDDALYYVTDKGFLKAWSIGEGFANPEGRLEKFKFSQGNARAQRSSEEKAMALSPDGLTIATLLNGIIRFWDAHTLKYIKDIKDDNANTLQKMFFTADGNNLLVSDKNGGVIMWQNVGVSHEEQNVGVSQNVGVPQAEAREVDLISFEDVPAVPAVPEVPAVTKRRLSTDKGPYAYDPVNQLIAIAPNRGFGSREVQVWSLLPNRQAASFQARISSESFMDDVDAIAFNKNGTELVACTQRQISIWNVAEHKRVATFANEAVGYRRLVFNHDGTVIAGLSPRRGIITLWERATGKVLKQLRFFQEEHGRKRQYDVGLESIDFSSDGSMLVIGGRYFIVVLRDNQYFTAHVEEENI